MIFNFFHAPLQPPVTLSACPSKAPPQLARTQRSAYLNLQPHALLRHLALAQRVVHEVGAEVQRGRDVEAEHRDQRLEQAQLGACGRGASRGQASKRQAAAIEDEA